MARVLRAFMLSTVTELRAVAEPHLEGVELSEEDRQGLELERMMAAQLEELRARRMGRGRTGPGGGPQSVGGFEV